MRRKKYTSAPSLVDMLWDLQRTPHGGGVTLPDSIARRASPVLHSNKSLQSGVQV